MATTASRILLIAVLPAAGPIAYVRYFSAPGAGVLRSVPPPPAVFEGEPGHHEPGRARDEAGVVARRPPAHRDRLVLDAHLQPLVRVRERELALLLLLLREACVRVQRRVGVRAAGALRRRVRRRGRRDGDGHDRRQEFL